MRKKNKKNSSKVILIIIFIGILVFLHQEGYIQFETYAINTNTMEVEDNMNIVLVNGTNKIPDDYIANLVEYNGKLVDSSIINDLDNMFKDAKKDGVNLKINTAYRDKEEQKDIYDRRIKAYKNEGMTDKAAIEKTNSEVQKPGYSEHETGLAIDFSNPSNPEDNEPMWEWLNANSYKYGFILRYPKDKIDITKVSNEEWHYRYVGKDIAKEMENTGECLEEYINRVL
jgi:serine-type D-Ala-D-Ala carboxypeptidase